MSDQPPSNDSPKSPKQTAPKQAAPKPAVEHSHEPTRDASQDSLVPPEYRGPNNIVQSAVPPEPDEPLAEDEPERPPRKIGKWIVHAIGALAALGWAAFWIMRTPPAPLSAETAVRPPVEVTPSAPEKMSAPRAERPPVPDGPMPVANASTFQYKNDVNAELRPIYLAKTWLATEENVPGGVRFNQLPWSPVLRVGDTSYDQGVVMAAPERGEAVAAFRVPEGALKFAALAGLAGGSNPAQQARCQRDGASVTFIVYTNGIEAFRKIVVGADGWHDEIRLDLSPTIKTVTLIVDNADGDHLCDTAVWIDARFMVEPIAATTAQRP